MSQLIVVFLLIIAVSSSDIKRKGVGEQQDETIISSIEQTKTQRLDYGHEINNILDAEENDPNRRCVDLIVLGISYRSLEVDVKKCFEAFGELIFCEVRIKMRKKKRKKDFL